MSAVLIAVLAMLALSGCLLAALAAAGARKRAQSDAGDLRVMTQAYSRVSQQLQDAEPMVALARTVKGTADGYTLFVRSQSDGTLLVSATVAVQPDVMALALRNAADIVEPPPGYRH